jgi:RimJ/RimL family protein N-acetyltransferase
VKRDVRLRDVVDDDLPIFFAFQSDPEAVRLAAIAPRAHEDFLAHWAKIRQDPTVRIRTVLADGQVAGNVLTFERDGHREVGYWIGRPFWGQGIATRALEAFLTEIPSRPLYGHAAKVNQGSIRVLEKCGFTRVGEDPEFSKIGDQFVEGVILRLD